jgi:hypothetical protein
VYTKHSKNKCLSNYMDPKLFPDPVLDPVPADPRIIP